MPDGLSVPVEDVTPPHDQVPEHEFTLMVDGGCGPTNPGGLGYYGYVISSDDASQTKVGNGTCGSGPEMTNNVAEFYAVVEGAKVAAAMIEELGFDLKKTCLHVLSDSQLVINQVTGFWNVRSEHLKPLKAKALEALGAFGFWNLTWSDQTEAAHAAAYGAYREVYAEESEKPKDGPPPPKSFDRAKRMAGMPVGVAEPATQWPGMETLQAVPPQEDDRLYADSRMEEMKKKAAAALGPKQGLGSSRMEQCQGCPGITMLANMARLMAQQLEQLAQLIETATRKP